ncbi:3-isopropylmalate isomerase/aconitase A [Cenarchaeum symbiosum A]|uniref:3-isopropylmalate isomerase/aconitase A n=1 Tax=Cenarchaeum symbiosum (strain A) TaxID=414004 RepID=A0RTP9_CENSY|nr:3-isopropylmalate isomerase/aconitase A [Cenarchaeum symbiosum A]
MEIATTTEMVQGVYERLREGIDRYRKDAGRPLTLSEKIMAGHMVRDGTDIPVENKDYVHLTPDRVALQDVTGQMVMLQFMVTRHEETALPTTIHCDHLIRAKVEGGEDMRVSLDENSEVFRFLKSAAARYGCGFWKPGAGIIHQVVLENYAFPGGLMIGTDSHTPNAGGLGMIAVGVGGMDAAEAMAIKEWELLYPKRIGVHLTGKSSGWTSPKDVILKVVEELTVSGGTNAIVEYLGPGASTISCTGKATITNMGAEMGATCSIFPYDNRMGEYLGYTGRCGITKLANLHRELLVADPEIEEDPSKYYSRVIEIDLSRLEPHIVGPHTPDLSRPISELSDDSRKNGYIDEISAALVGSCTNSSYEDMSRAAGIAEQAKARGLQAQVPLMISPGSEQIRATIERDGQMQSLKDIGATVLANACGPCIGQWSRPELEENEENTIVSSFNRNFPGRNDGSRSTMNFIGSPELVVAMALGGRLSFNPLKDELTAADGTKFMLKPPPPAPEVPKDGFQTVEGAYVPPPADPHSVKVVIDESSERLEELETFPPWDGADLEGLRVMAKAKGKCTTDHISPAGAWLAYRGHLDHLSDNMLLGAVSAYHNEVGKGKNLLTGEMAPYHKVARAYMKAGIRWVIIGDGNYGEGSSREHAAMSPRHLGCAAVIARSFARIHETNLKKQGILALVFSDPADYEKILEDDTINIVGLKSMAPHTHVKCLVVHADGSEDTLDLSHSYSASQIGWFRAGSALNVLRDK